MKDGVDRTESKTETAVNFVKPKPNRKPRFFENRTKNSHFFANRTPLRVRTASLVYKCLNVGGPPYLIECLQRMADVHHGNVYETAIVLVSVDRSDNESCDSRQSCVSSRGCSGLERFAGVCDSSVFCRGV